MRSRSTQLRNSLSRDIDRQSGAITRHRAMPICPCRYEIPVHERLHFRLNWGNRATPAKGGGSKPARPATPDPTGDRLWLRQTIRLLGYALMNDSRRPILLMWDRRFAFVISAKPTSH